MPMTRAQILARTLRATAKYLRYNDVYSIMAYLNINCLRGAKNAREKRAAKLDEAAALLEKWSTPCQ